METGDNGDVGGDIWSDPDDNVETGDNVDAGHNVDVGCG